MASCSSLLARASLSGQTQGLRALAAACAPLLQSSRTVSSSAAASSGAAAGSGSGGAAPGEPDAFTAALQHKTEEELRQLTMKQAELHTPEAAEEEAQEGQQQGGAEALPPHGKREIGGYKGPEPTRYSRSGASDWEIKGRCTDF